MKTTGKTELSAFVNYGLLTQFCAAAMGKSDISLRLSFSRADEKLMFKNYVRPLIEMIEVAVTCFLYCLDGLYYCRSC